MTKLLVYFAITACLGATATLAITKGSVNLTPNPESRLAADGAFRDGLYLGKLAAENGLPLRPAIGRWSTEQDRSMFTTGYRRGYQGAVGSAQ